VLLCRKLKGICGDCGEACKGGVSMERGVSVTTVGGVGVGEGASGTAGNGTGGKAADGKGADAGAAGTGPEGDGSRGTSGIGKLPGTRIVFLFLLPRFVTAL
jgi:hypothetical protein